MGKSTISTGPFSIATLVYQRVWILWDLVAKLRWCGTLQRAVSITAFAVLWGDRFLPGFPSKNFRENPVGRDSGEVQEPNMPACSPWARNSHAECINWAFSMATWQIIRKICYITGWGLVASGMNVNRAQYGDGYLIRFVRHVWAEWDEKAPWSACFFCKLDALILRLASRISRKGTMNPRIRACMSPCWFSKSHQIAFFRHPFAGLLQERHMAEWPHAIGHWSHRCP